MIPFRLRPEPGTAIWKQVVYAAKKAMVGGQMRPRDPFPSVRTLSKALRINPNTAHKVIGQLIADRLIEVRPGMGTFVTTPPIATRAARGKLLKTEVEHLVVEARKLGLELRDVMSAVELHWSRLEGTRQAARRMA